MTQTEQAKEDTQCTPPVITLGGVTEAIRDKADTTCMLTSADSADMPIHGVCIDSRKATPGCLFICKGAAFKPAFLASAVEHGAVAYLCQGEAAEDGELSIPSQLAEAAPGIPAIVVEDVRRAMAFASAAAYDYPDKNLTVVGVTGTKGKSTTTYMLHAIMKAAGIEPSMLGSIETDDGIEHFESHNTTPESPDLWRHLRNTVDAKRRHMVMEVSSQGLKYDRVLGLNFDIACFLNIGRDHISAVEHPTFEDYFASKLRIFDQCETAIVNMETDHVEEVLQAAKHAPKLVTIGVNNDKALIHATDISSRDGVIRFTVHDGLGSQNEAHEIKLGIAGLFNIENALCAIAIARLLGIDYAAIAKGLEHVKVPGRMEVIRDGGNITAIVDYAHNKLSFETLFSSIQKEYPGQRIIAIFGAPGGKAFERREVLPQTAGKFADLLIFTEEDPAHDRVEDICAELASNTPKGVAHEVIYDREAAFKHAVDLAKADGSPTVIAFLAKGEEELQHRGDEFVPIKSDSTIAHEVLGA